MQNNELLDASIPKRDFSQQEEREAPVNLSNGTDSEPETHFQRLDNLFSTIIHGTFDKQAAWSVRETTTWIIVTRETMTLPDQGWKLHVSAGLSSAEDVLRAVLPILQRAEITFKVASSFRQLRMLNHGFMGQSQIGKFITVYSTGEDQAVQLAQQLDQATRNERGPRVPSDLPLHEQSLVSYRYGSYTGRLMNTAGGKVVSVLTTPAGELVADLRKRGSSVPDWLADPFLASGIAQPLKQNPFKLIAERYLPLTPLYESARGGTISGVDTQQMRPCVLKYARRDAYLDFDGKDARDVLRYEADILAKLALDESFPALFDMVEQDDALYMVMEEIYGETLGACAERAFAQGFLPAEQVVQWGREIARILGKLHALGLVYRDLKPTNLLITPEKRLRFIDFELVLAQGVQHKKSDIGTRGFMSPQHRLGGPASIADDIYSLGALLFYLVTHASPITAPDPSNLLARPLRLLNPTLNEGLLHVITTCLEPDPAARFHSMEIVEAALANVSGEELVKQPALGQEALARLKVWNPDHALTLARQLGETICQTAVHRTESPGVTWLSTAQSAQGVPRRGLNVGVAGTLLALAELVSLADTPGLRETLREGTRWLMQSDALIAKPIPGLYTGEAGVGAALLRVGQILQDADILAAACEKGRWVARQPHFCQDLMHGTAGRLRFHLLLWDETGEAEHLQAALEAGEWLCTVAEDAGEGALCWTLPADYTGLAYVGYAHGAAGIADALLDLFEATQDERFLTPVTGVYQLLKRLAVPVLSDQDGLNWPLYVHDKKREMAGVYWCHGASGISTFLLHASEHQCFPEAGALARRAAWTVARGSRWAGPTQCHGLAGNIECLLDIFQASGEQGWYTEARALAILLEAFAVRQRDSLAWSSDDPSRVSPDYLLGYAGVLTSLLRLANPDQQPRQLSRRGFRYRPHTLFVAP